MAGISLVWILCSVSGISLVLLVLRLWRSLEHNFYFYQQYKIPKYDDSLLENPLYRRAAAYISSLPSLEDSDFANIFSSGSKRKIGGGDRLSLQIEDGRTVRDCYLGATIFWSCVRDEAFIMRVRRRDRRRILRSYLNHVESVAEEIQNRRDLRLYTISRVNSGERRWRSAPFSHPSTLETIAMDPDLKNRVRADLESFLKSRSYYNRLGRAWRRSYLLYGASGTGKSTFAAAIARFLHYDLYYLDSCNSDLKDFLFETNPRSVILLEDLDRHLESKDLSEILNFMDGVFSCCGEERVMVFTLSGSKKRIDPAVIRAGRADVHIHFPYCDFTSFKSMAGSYLGLKDHKLFPQIEEIFDSGVNLSHAEIGEIMISNRSSTNRALKTVISALQERKLLKGENAPPSEDHPESGSLKEIKRLYGLIKLRSGSRKEGRSPSPLSESL